MPDNTLKNVPGMKNAAPVPVYRVEDLSQTRFIEKHIFQSNPCVIRGAIRHWPAVENWQDSEYLKAKAGHHDIYFYQTEYHITPQRLEPGKLTIPLAEALDRMHDPRTGLAIVATALPVELMPDLGRLSFLSQAPPPFTYPAARFFFYRGASTTWHYHPFDETLMCQVVGAKKIGLLPAVNPQAKAVHDIFVKEDYYDDASAFDALDGAELPWMLATLEPGDSLYIPPLWWHGIVTVGEDFGATAAVTWRSPLDVEAGIIRKMASGAVHMQGVLEAAWLPTLKSVARDTGLEEELRIGWAKQFGRAVP